MTKKHITNFTAADFKGEAKKAEKPVVAPKVEPVVVEEVVAPVEETVEVVAEETAPVEE